MCFWPLQSLIIIGPWSGIRQVAQATERQLLSPFSSLCKHGCSLESSYKLHSLRALSALHWLCTGLAPRRAVTVSTYEWYLWHKYPVRARNQPVAGKTPIACTKTNSVLVSTSIHNPLLLLLYSLRCFPPCNEHNSSALWNLSWDYEGSTRTSPCVILLHLSNELAQSTPNVTLRVIQAIRACWQELQEL